MGFMDDIGGTLMGGLGGAGAGFLLGGPMGAAAGAGLGGIGGYLNSRGTHDAANAQRGALDEAMKRLQQFSVQQQQNRQQDLQKTMAFYGPADSYLRSIYAQPPPPPPNPTVPRGPRLGPLGGAGG